METENLSQGLQVVGVGVGGVFLNLLVLMFVMYFIGKVFGKKQPAKGGKGASAQKPRPGKGAAGVSAKKKPATDAAAPASQSASENKPPEPAKKKPE